MAGGGIELAYDLTGRDVDLPFIGKPCNADWKAAGPGVPYFGYQYCNCSTREEATNPHLSQSHLESVAHCVPLSVYDSACGDGAVDGEAKTKTWYAREMLQRITDGGDSITAVLLRVSAAAQDAGAAGPAHPSSKQTLASWEGAAFLRYNLSNGETYHCISNDADDVARAAGDVHTLPADSDARKFTFVTAGQLQKAWASAEVAGRGAADVACLALEVAVPADAASPPPTAQWPTLSNDAARWVKKTFPQLKVFLINIMSVELESSGGCMMNHRLLFGVDTALPTDDGVAPSAFDLTPRPPATVFPELFGRRGDGDRNTNGVPDFLIGEGFNFKDVPATTHWLRVAFKAINTGFAEKVPEARDVVGIESCEAVPMA